MNEPAGSSIAHSAFDAHIGTEWGEFGEDWGKARIPVSAELLQPFGLVHGGVISALAESLTSHTTMEAVAGDGMIAIGQTNQTSFIRPITAGHVNAEARARHRGRTTWVWQVEVTDDDGNLCALVSVTIAVRPRRRD